MAHLPLVTFLPEVETNFMYHLAPVAFPPGVETPV